MKPPAPDDSRELVTAGEFGLLVAGVAVTCAIAAIVLWLLRRRMGAPHLQTAAVACALGTGLLPLWWVYNLIEDSLGLDSLAAAGINLVMFALFGAAAGLVLRRTAPRATEK